MTYVELVKLASDAQVRVLVAAVRQLHSAGRLRAALTREQWASAQDLVDAVEKEAALRVTASRARGLTEAVVLRQGREAHPSGEAKRGTVVAPAVERVGR